MSNHFQYPFNPINWPAVPHDFTSDLSLGIYTKEETQRYVFGTRYITWDGRVYKYMGVTTQGVTSYSACCNTLDALTGWETAKVTEAGTRQMVVTETDAVAEDSLAGAMVQIYDSTIANSTQHFIVGNDKGTGSVVQIYLEFPFPHKVTASDSLEMFENPYRLIQGNLSANAYAAWLGVANVTAATGYKVWVQTWGPAILSPGNTTLDDPTGGERQVFFKADGSISEIDGSGVTASKSQSVGYILNQGTTNMAGPQVYLMCST